MGFFFFFSPIHPVYLSYALAFFNKIQLLEKKKKKESKLRSKSSDPSPKPIAFELELICERAVLFQGRHHKI